MPVRQHILVVEDDPLVADVIAAALEDDYETSLVETSAAAMQCLAVGKVDLMLLDCTLPDGVDSELLATAERRCVPVVLMSGDPERVRRLAAEPRPFILKPFALADLVAAVRRELDGAAPAAA